MRSQEKPEGARRSQEQPLVASGQEGSMRS